MDAETPTESTASSGPSVAKAGGIVAAMLLLSRVLGLVRTQVMGIYFGQNDFTDAYTLSFMIPDTLFYLISAGSISSVFIPVFTEYLHTNREKDAWKTFSVVTSVMGLIVLGFVAVTWIYAPQLAHILAGKKPLEVQQNMTYMSRIVVPTQFAFLVGGLVVGTLYARRIFAVPGLGPNIYNLGIIFGAIVLSRFVSPAVSGMSWGALVGAFVGSLLIPLWMMYRVGGHFKFTLDLQDEGAKKVFRLMIPIIFGMSLPSVFPIITKYFMTFYPSGLNSAMENANQLMQAPLGVFGQSLALAVAPALSEFYAKKDMERFLAQFSLTLRNVVFLTVPFTALFAVFSHQIVQALFQHGAFRAEATERTALCITTAGLGIFAWCMQPVLMRGYFSLQNTLRPIIFGTICTVLYVGGSWFIVSQQYPFYWLPAWASVCVLLMAVAMFQDLSDLVGGLDGKALLITFLKSAVAATVAGVALYASTLVLPSSTHGLGKWAAIGMIGIFGIGFAWVYYFAARFLQMPETAYLDRALAKLNRFKK